MFPSDNKSCFAFEMSLLFTASKRIVGLVVIEVLHGKALYPFMKDKYVLGV